MFLIACVARYASGKITRDEAKKAIVFECQGQPEVLPEIEEVLIAVDEELKAA